MIPFIEYYMLAPDPYNMIRNAGTDQENHDLAVENIKRFFPNVTKEEYDSYIGGSRFIHEIMDMVQNAFLRWYSFDCTGISLNNTYQKGFNSYAYVDRINPVFILIDQLLETVILDFMLVILKWAKELENDIDERFCYQYLIYLLNEFCIFGELPAEDAKAALMEKIADDLQLLNLASDCHWAIMVFTIAHEIAHVYQTHTEPEYWRKHLKEAEFHADAVAYDIFLRLIMDKQCGDLIIEEYTYLAPMMYMDFFSLYYYTDYSDSLIIPILAQAA